jgi:hypothetical protein
MRLIIGELIVGECGDYLFVYVVGAHMVFKLLFFIGFQSEVLKWGFKGEFQRGISKENFKGE